MCADDERKRWTANAVRLGVLTLGVCLLGLAGPPQAGGQNTATASHTVAVKSDPPGAIIWKKEGRDYTCTNTLTPGTVELAFHDDNDVQRIRVRRFGYSDVNLDVKSTDKEVGVALNSSKPVSSSFLVESDAPPEVKPLNEALKKEFEKTLLTDPEAFRCAPFELDDINVHWEERVRALVLSVDIWLDRSFGGLAFRQARHAFNEQERKQRTGRIALDSGIAEILARFHRVAAKFPEVKDIIVVGSYSTTEARISTEKRRTLSAIATPQAVYVVGGAAENDVVKNQDAMGVIVFVMPVAQIPDTLDKKTVSDAVLAKGEISLAETGDDSSKPPSSPR